MVKWTGGRSERTLNRSAANDRKEPRVTDAAERTKAALGTVTIKGSKFGPSLPLVTTSNQKITAILNGYLMLMPIHRYFERSVRKQNVIL